MAVLIEKQVALNSVNLAAIAEMLGHKTSAMVKCYTYLSKEHTLNVIERMNRAVFGE